ncbi:phosphonate metabolism protein/1,5-bisphosphokinase (PRPP-forming) PhnN [Microvirga sp. VF16]|uniref:phosphonate metabolism protein/1,5-bisphosphokinase (PRPP-forming) PhnN n=1 Tax=Microvirga sp. VF16 TaxID=2807101 RepID=UPI00193DE55D|nr:phosphonate metabolism protein/1,5-bisphosphokinase (PRPP-forming) PhnN [Microvirga sp. VF16]QRM32531.1 phosphonate metabolism protein/1,5-bisphosphokinase (PRPP-forming) PhnN [Microvirga sp. VF16]
MANRSSNGQLVLVVGPSGAGKDTLLTLAREQLARDDRFRFVRRVITRQAGGGEDSAFMAEEVFRQHVEEDAFALHWQAHGLFYGLPNDLDDWLAQGHVAVANGSRAVVPEARRKYPRLRIVNVTAPPEVLANRLRKRGREAGDAVSGRLMRGVEFEISGPDVEEIANAGPPDIAAECFVQALRRWAQN